MAVVPRPLLWLVLLCALLMPASTGLSHAVPVDSIPEADALLQASPGTVRITFNEPVQLLRGEDFNVVDSTGRVVSTAPGQVMPDRRVIEVPVDGQLSADTYTARFQVIGADSHVVPGILVFGVGVSSLGPPMLGGAGGGPSETSVWFVVARLAEMITLGGLLGLVAFRWLVWGPSIAAGRVGTAERERLLVWWRDMYWVAFGVLALAAMVAQGYMLVVQSASVLGVGVWEAARDAAGISQVLGETDFGGLVQLRGAVLFGLFAVGALQFLREYGGGAHPRQAQATGALIPSLVMAGLVLVVMGTVAGQGHPRVAEWPWLQMGAQLVHLSGSAVWMTGLVLVWLVHRRAPSLASGGGPGLAAGILTRFSSVALVALVAIITTGIVRTLGELEAPEELWQTAFGRSIVYKLVLLSPIFAIALYNRRIVLALRAVDTPGPATLRRVRMTVGGELVLSLAIVVVAAVLVAQVPGGS